MVPLKLAIMEFKIASDFSHFFLFYSVCTILNLRIEFPNR